MTAQRKIRLRKHRDRTQRRLRAGKALCGMCEHWGNGIRVRSEYAQGNVGVLGMCWREKSYWFKISVPGDQIACDFFRPIQ